MPSISYIQSFTKILNPKESTTNKKAPSITRTLGAIMQDNETLTKEWWTSPFLKK